jgi:hypothetical protein
MKRVLLITAMLAAILSACAPAAPTVDPAQVQASAVSAASTMIALTIEAIPSATPPPPTPLPSPTVLALPTLGLLPTLQNQPTATTSSGSSGDCNQLMDVGASGPKAPVVIQNTTKGPVTFSMGVSRKNTFGQCGYMSWANIPKANNISVSVPLVHTNAGDACYWAYAWVNDPKHTATVSGGGYCIDNQLKWTFVVSYDKIKLTPP